MGGRRWYKPPRREKNSSTGGGTRRVLEALLKAPDLCHSARKLEKFLLCGGEKKTVENKGQA